MLLAASVLLVEGVVRMPELSVLLISVLAAVVSGVVAVESVVLDVGEGEDDDKLELTELDDGWEVGLEEVVAETVELPADADGDVDCPVDPVVVVDVIDDVGFDDTDVEELSST